MANHYELHEIDTSIEVIPTTPPQPLPSSIDYIDLTQDTPRRRATQNNGISVRFNPSNTRSRNKTSIRRSLPLHVEDVIHVEDTPTDESCTVPSVNNSFTGKQVTLTCPVCMEELSSKSKPVTTRCGHIFCERCLLTVHRTKKKCPTCQASFTVKSLIRLYF